MERNAEQLAWAVLLASFAVFCLLLVAIPTGVSLYRANAMDDRPVQLDVIKGTTLWLPSGSRQEVNAASRLMLGSGEQVRTAADSEALLSFYDGSNVRLWPNTIIRIETSKASAFQSSDTEFVLTQDGGHARYEVAIPATAARRFEIKTPQSNALLREGSYKLEVSPDASVVSVSSGSATVSTGTDAVEVLRGEWTKATGQSPPTRPESDVHNIIANGEFIKGINGWQPGSRAEVDDVVPGTVAPGEQDNHTYVELARLNAQKRSETFLHGTINEDVTDYGLLRLSFQVRILTQDPINPGALGVDYPLIVRVHYRDSTGSEATWTEGFYVQPEDQTSRLPRDAMSVTQSLWTDESFDLLDPDVVSPRPSEILWIEFAASGTNYQSDIGHVQLLVD